MQDLTKQQVFEILDTQTRNNSNKIKIINTEAYNPFVKEWFCKHEQTFTDKNIIENIINLYEDNFTLSQEEIGSFLSLIVQNNKIDLGNIYNNSDFVLNVAQTPNQNLYRTYTLNFLRHKSIAHLNLTNRRKQFLEHTLNTAINNNINNTQYLQDLFCELYFEDTTNNVLINLNIIKAAKPDTAQTSQHFEKNFLLNFLKDFDINLSLSQISKTKKKFDNSKIDWTQSLNNLINICKDKFINETNQKLAESQNTSTFEGQPFTMLCHVVSAPDCYFGRKINNYLRPITPDSYNRICCSLINDENIYFFGVNNPQVSYLIFGYNQIEANSLVNARPTDAYSYEGDRNEFDKYNYNAETDVPSAYFNYKKFMQSTTNYNEVKIELKSNALNNKNKPINVPDYLIAINKPNKVTNSVSEHLNIPIKTIIVPAYTKKMQAANIKKIEAQNTYKNNKNHGPMKYN